MAALSPAYNEIPETRGTPRGKGAVAGGRDLADAEKLGHHQVAPPITAAEARGNSRPVSAHEFQRLAAQGLSQIAAMAWNRRPVTELDRWWPQVKADSFRKCQEPWGGATVDSHTATPLQTDADKYALSVKPQGMDKVSVPEDASQAQFEAAMDRALKQYRPELEKGSHYLGIFHDDDNHRIDIDPVVVVDTVGEVETIGAYSHAVGGAYHFRSGDGFFPPHVDDQGTAVAA